MLSMAGLALSLTSNLRMIALFRSNTSSDILMTTQTICAHGAAEKNMTFIAFSLVGRVKEMSMRLGQRLNCHGLATGQPKPEGQRQQP